MMRLSTSGIPWFLWAMSAMAMLGYATEALLFKSVPDSGLMFAGLIGLVASAELRATRLKIAELEKQIKETR